MLEHVMAGSAVTMPYYGGSFYDDGTIRQERYYIDDRLAAGFLQGRYTSEYRINAKPPDYVYLASGPPWQYPLPDGTPNPEVTFTAYSERPWDAVYDPLDSFYVPFWGFENISRPGPSIAIWKSSA
jgi:hypothetical protein